MHVGGVRPGYQVLDVASLSASMQDCGCWGKLKPNSRDICLGSCHSKQLKQQSKPMVSIATADKCRSVRMHTSGMHALVHSLGQIALPYHANVRATRFEHGCGRCDEYKRSSSGHIDGTAYSKQSAWNCWCCREAGVVGTVLCT